MSHSIEKTERNSALELLRILAMFMIVLHHACFHSGFAFPASELSLNRLFVQWSTLGQLGVNIYVLITGYFLCRKKKGARSLIALLLQLWFYSWVLFLICRFGFQVSYSGRDYLAWLFPTVFEEYWFFTTYAVLYLLSPYINTFLEKAERKSVRNLIAVMFLLWVIIPTFTGQSMSSGALAQFLLMYTVGAYYRCYPDCVIRSRKAIACITGAAFVLLFASTAVLDILGKYMEVFQYRGTMLYSRDSLLTVVCAVGLFSCFLNIPAFTNRSVNAISACTFGVYLIHENPAVRDLIWLRGFRLAERSGSDFLIAQILASALTVFCASVLAEYLRRKTLGRYFDRLAVCMEKGLEKAGAAFAGCSLWNRRH